MSDFTDKIYEQALDLPIEDRLILIDKLLSSTNLSLSQEIDKAWSLEAEKRCQELKSGKAKLISGDEVFEKIPKRFS